jgi:hypothetical protein
LLSHDLAPDFARAPNNSLERTGPAPAAQPAHSPR